MPEELELMHTKEDYGIEHVEIIAYRTLIQLCERLGVSDAIPASTKHARRTINGKMD